MELFRVNIISDTTRLANANCWDRNSARHFSPDVRKPTFVAALPKTHIRAYRWCSPPSSRQRAGPICFCGLAADEPAPTAYPMLLATDATQKQQIQPKADGDVPL
jgi:hypothetical protein